MKNSWLIQGTSDVAKKAAEVAQKMSNNWSMVSFIHNGSEIKSWMGHSFKTKSTTSSNIFSMAFLR